MNTPPSLSRRRFIPSATATLAAVGSGGLAGSVVAQVPRSAADPAFRVRNGKIRQSIMGWCFKDHFDVLTLAKHCKEIGLVAMEGIGAEFFPEIKKLGLEISLVGGHGFAQGPCDPKHYDSTVTALEKAIEIASQVGSKKVITFTGMKFEGMDRDKAIKDCLRCWKQVLPLAEKKGITLVLEHLNTRDDSHPMKGHPGYFGDDVDFCFDLVRQIGSKNFKLLFDIYHVSVMNGDVIRRIRKNHELIGHYHTAGNPGRAELDDTQEINYPPIMREILKTGYTGYVAQEFIPTWDNPLLALRHAAMVCDV